MTAALVSPGRSTKLTKTSSISDSPFNVARPTCKEDPMPVAQFIFSRTVAFGTSPIQAPSTTKTGSHPASAKT